MAQGKTVYLRQQGKQGEGEPLQIFPGVKAKDLKQKSKSMDNNSVLALERGDSEVIVDNEEEIYHQVQEGESIYATDRGVFGRN